MLVEAIGQVKNVETVERNGVPVGLISGYLTTWSPNRPFDGRTSLPARFEQTSFSKSLGRHLEEGRNVKFYSEHVETIGIFPIDSFKPDDTGLFATGEVNLETQVGRETYSFAKQGALDSFSIGYEVQAERMEGGQRVATEVHLFEASIVSIPANNDARITSLENMTARELEKALLQTGLFTRSASKEMASKIHQLEEIERLEQEQRDKEAEAQKALISEIEEFTQALAK